MKPNLHKQKRKNTIRSEAFTQNSEQNTLSDILIKWRKWKQNQNQQENIFLVELKIKAKDFKN